MTRSEAIVLIKEHLDDYRERLERDSAARLESYRMAPCPLCSAILHGDCGLCLEWHRIIDGNVERCNAFRGRVNSTKDKATKLDLIDRLETELDRWAGEELEEAEMPYDDQQVPGPED